MKTIAQQIKWNFETNGSLEIKDKNENQIYYERSNGCWSKGEYDSKGNLIYIESSNGFWSKHEYDSQGVVIYYENSNGTIQDNRPKSCENREIVIEGIKYKLTKV
jgi:glucose dehydrogenase